MHDDMHDEMHACMQLEHPQTRNTTAASELMSLTTSRQSAGVPMADQVNL